MNRRSTRLTLFLCAVLAILPGLAPVYGASATWNLDPTNNNWNTATNWTPATVPDRGTNTATFAVSNQTDVSLDLVLQLGGITFNQGASAFTITVIPKFGLTFIEGAGITNNSGTLQSFVTDVDPSRTQGLLIFSNSATAGSQTLFTNRGGTVAGDGGSATLFTDSSTADHGTFVNNGGAVSGAVGGFIGLSGSATAAEGTFTSEAGAVDGATGGPISFSDSASAGDAAFTIDGAALSGASGGFMRFMNTSDAGNSTIVVNAGVTDSIAAFVGLMDDSSGGTARVELSGDGYLDISFHNAPGVTCGSLEGSGNVFLGAVNLTVGANDLSTTFSGIIQDGGQNEGSGGSLTKIGTGTLTLSNSNTYTGGTVVQEGALLLTSRIGSGTGPGLVQVNGGTLGGTGRISGAVIIGSGAGGGAILAPGQVGPGSLTIKQALTFNADATYQVDIRATSAAADRVTAKGVTIASGAIFAATPFGGGTLAQGTVLTVINNASTRPIAGTFSNLADGSTITVGNNNLQANYEGGDGNDLTLTVVF